MTAPFMKITRRATLSLVVAGQVDTLDLGDGLHAFKRTTSATKAELDEDAEFVLRVQEQPGAQSQGIIDDANLARLLAGADFEAAELTLCGPELMEHFRLNGFREHPELGYKIFEARRDDAYDALTEDPAALERLIRVDHASHLIFDRSGGPLPTPIFYSYMDGRMSSDAYDLEAAAKVLLAREDVQVFPRGAGWRQEPDYAGTATEARQCIADVPDYNGDDETRQTIHFAFRPSAGDYRRIWERCLSYKGQYPSTERHRAVFDLDLLGLRAAGAAKTGTYHGEPRKDA